MIDGNLLRIVAAAGEVKPEDCVIEVGPGTGSLTEELLATGCRVVAVEIDRNLAELLRRRLGERANFTLIEGDALDGKHSLNAELLAVIRGAGSSVGWASPTKSTDGGQCPPYKSIKLVANLPYQIASPLVIEMIIAGVELLVFTVQKEVGQRLKAVEGHDAYGPLSVMANLLAEVEILRTMPPQAFWPAPKIESALVRMRRRDQLKGRAPEFTVFIHAVFSYRRKQLRKAMTEAGFSESVVDAALGSLKIDLSLRPEEISPSQWLDLFERISPATSSSAASAV